MVGVPGGLTAYVGEFLMQFYAINHIAGLIIVMVLLLLYFLLRNLIHLWKLDSDSPLCLIPIVFLTLFFMDINTQIGAALSILFALCFVWLVYKISHENLRLIVSLLLVPIVYGCIGGGWFVYTGLMVFGNIQSNKTNSWYQLGIILFSIMVPLVTRQYLTPLSWSDTWIGNAFYRTDSLPNSIWLLVLSPIVVLALLFLVDRIHGLVKYKSVLTLSVYIVLIAVTVTMVQLRVDHNKETIYKLDYLLKREEWRMMIEVAETHPFHNKVFVSYANIALLNEGQLANRLFDFDQYPSINEFWTSSYLPMFLVGELYYTLDMYNASRAYFFMGNTQSPKGQSPAMYKRLAELETIRGHARAGMKYVQALKHTLFYRKWAEEMEQALLSNKYSPKLQHKIDRYTSNNTFLAKELLYNVACKHGLEPTNKKVADFLRIKYILANNQEGFISSMPELQGEIEYVLPRVYQEFLLMYAYRVHDNTLVQQWKIENMVINDFYNYLQINQSGLAADVIKTKLSEVYSHTYWFYMQYKNEN